MARKHIKPRHEPIVISTIMLVLIFAGGVGCVGSAVGTRRFDVGKAELSVGRCVGWDVCIGCNVGSCVGATVGVTVGMADGSGEG